MVRQRLLIVILAAAVLLAAFAPAWAVLPAYIQKPPVWTSKLATTAGPFVTDVQFAQWVRAVQGAAPAPPRVSFLAGFHQCYGGGFLTELQRQGVQKFGANSASRFFEPSSYDLPNNRSYFTYSWFYRAINPVGSTDAMITDDGYAYTRDGINPPALPPVPDNPWANWENAQYLSAPAAGPPPEAIGAAANKFAILWVGRPDPNNKDLADLNQVYRVLNGTYGFARNNIYILYGAFGPPAAAVPGSVGWATSDAQATAANLQAAFATWLNGKLAAQPAQVVFWAGDHGSADFPILISVDNMSTGVAGSGVNNRVVAALPPGPVVYEANGGTNHGIWEVIGGGNDVDEIAFSEQSVFNQFATTDGGWIYFSVDRTSKGAPNSGIATDILATGGPVSASIYTATPNSNRLAFDAKDLGLLPAGVDELNALSLRNSASVVDPKTGLPNRPFFFSFRGSSQVNVYDPAVGGWYVYYDFGWDFAAAPLELDGLALWDDGARDGAGLLYFDPFQDRLLFSVGRQENVFPWNAFAACDILKLGPDGMGGALLTQWRFCQQLGLVPGQDNLDALDLGIGTNGEPYDTYPSSYNPSYPSTPWPNPPYPGSEPSRGPRPEPTVTVQPPPPPGKGVTKVPG
jgi:hypothetical protein